MQAPAKPWESSTEAPAVLETSRTVPPRPQNQPYQTGYNSYTPGGYGGYSNYGNRYGYGYNSGYGGYGSGMYGSYGGYGSGMYGGYGGMNRFGMNRFGPGMDGEMGLAQRMEQSTQQTFQMLDQVVQAFGGFAQMLESTFVATQSSFMAMVGVAEQFGHIKEYFSKLFSIVGLLRFIKRISYKMRGLPIPLDESAITEFSKSDKPLPNRRPLYVFLAMVIGLPWLMSKLVQTKPTESKNLEFGQAIYDFNGDQPGDLTFKKGDLVAILNQIDANWYRGRLQNGRIGIFPKDYIQLIQKTEPTSNNIQATTNVNSLAK